MSNGILIIQKLIKTSIIIIFVINFLAGLFFSIINPEAYIFGTKLSGINAIIYILVNGITGMVIGYILFRKEMKGIYLSLVFFVVNLIEIIFTNIFTFYIYNFSYLFLVGLVLTIGLIMLKIIDTV